MNPHFRCLMNTYDYEDALFRLDPKLKDFRNLKKNIFNLIIEMPENLLRRKKNWMN